MYHCELVEMTTMQKWLICTSEEFTVICVNPALMQRVILSVLIWSLREEEMLKLNLEYHNRNVSCNQKANQVNELFPNSLNQHLSSENPVLAYKKRKKKIWPTIPRAADEPQTLCSRALLAHQLPPLPQGRCPSSAGEQICTTPALPQPSPHPLLLPLDSLELRTAGWCFL